MIGSRVCLQHVALAVVDDDSVGQGFKRRFELVGAPHCLTLGHKRSQPHRFALAGEESSNDASKSKRQQL